MPLVVEDGTIVAGADSFITLANAATYFAKYGPPDAWDNADDTARETALRLAAQALWDVNRYRWRGTLVSAVQRLPWPRSGATLRNGPTFDSDAIPWQVVDGQCELALRHLQGFSIAPDQTRGGKVKSETVGPISTTYADDAPGYDTFAAVDALLSPLLEEPAQARSDLQVFGAPETDGFFTVGMHSNPG